MNNKLQALFLIVLLFAGFDIFCQTQKDTLQRIDLQEVSITATRTEKFLSAVPMPVLLISQAQIRQMGSLRLNEILQEQTGLAIINDHGQGIQMQGFNPDYTLILIDGEPLIGRTAGTLELSRLAVANIKQIEIVKGASSSLYGSEALAGVINIITENPQATKASLSIRYGTNQTTDLGFQASFKKEKLKGSIFLNRYGSSGYDFTPNTFGQTVEPFQNHTLQSKIAYDFSKTLKLTVSGRYFIENQENRFEVSTANLLAKVAGSGQVQDFNLNPTLDWRITDRWKTQFRLYYSAYQTQTTLNYLADNQLFEENFFRQTFLRSEIQTEYFVSEKHSFILGLGNLWESVAATRYVGKKQFENRYLYAQYEFLPSKQWNITLGSRFDLHTVYGSQLSPKIAVQYEINPKIVLRASAGMGFKAPDFRQLYLNFNNSVAGYSVFGSEELPTILAQLQAQNQIAEILLNPTELGDLQAERSVSYNVGIKLKPTDKLSLNLNFFRNDVSHLIESQVVARRNNGQNIFSYRNLKSIFTQGIEADLSYQFHQNVCFSAGYQFLLAKDKEVLEQIGKGELFRRNPETLVTSRIAENEYGGLFGRSRNMFNIKVFYENKAKGMSLNLRTIYRGKYGFGDRNGNLILDEESEYVVGFWTLHASASKEFWKKRLRFQVGVDNILDYRDETNMPNLAGRLMWVSLQCQF